MNFVIKMPDISNNGHVLHFSHMLYTNDIFVSCSCYKNITVEGVGTSGAIVLKAKEFEVDTPVMAVINNLVIGKISLTHAIQNLLSRPQRQE